MLQESLLIWSSNQKKIRNLDINPKSSPIIDEHPEVLEMNLNLSDEKPEVLEMDEINLNLSDKNQEVLEDEINLSVASLDCVTGPDVTIKLVVDVHNEQFELSDDEPELSDSSI